MAASKSKMNDGRPQPHVDIAQMKANGHDPADVIALAGYVGVAPSDDVVRLHPGLDDMSLSVDIDARDIVATTDAPVSTMPMGGVVVWVIRTAEVKFRKTRTVSARAQQMRFYFGAGRALEPDADSDRLNIQLSSASARSKVPPVYVPPEVCNPCQSTNCHSSCSICTSQM